MHNSSLPKLSLLVIIFVALPACRKQTKVVKVPEYKEELNVPMGQRNENSMIFDEAAEALVLEGDDDLIQNQHVAIANEDSLVDVSGGGSDEPEINFEEAPEKEELAAVIYFKYDSEKPSADQDENLKLAVSKAQEIVKSGKKVACKGHACEWGHRCRVRNFPLSAERSNWVADYLVKNEVPASSLKAFGVGSEEPVVFEHTKEGQSPNRRVEIYALSA